jgi:hypothetical protein
MALYKFRGRKVPKFKQGAKVKVKDDSPSPHHGLAGVVKLTATEETGLVYGVEFDSTPGDLANYSVIKEEDLETAS